MRTSTAAVLLSFAVLAGAPLRAQSALEQQCDPGVTQDAARRFCHLVAQSLEVTQPRVGLAFAGGNPVPGTASTLGRRLGTVPRLSIAARGTGVYLRLPALRERNDDINALVPAGSIDVTLGLLNGASVAPTVGGLGSVDLLASAGVMPVPTSKGFSGGSSVSYAGGIRLGILRESFVAPGISASAMYRRVNGVEFGTQSLTGADSAYFNIDGLSVLSLRAAISKRLLFLGATAGVGYDRFKSDVAFRSRNGTTLSPLFEKDGLSSSRTVLFANVSWTLLVLNLVAEGGIQSAGETSAGTIPSSTRTPTGRSAPFGSLAVRLAI